MSSQTRIEQHALIKMDEGELLGFAGLTWRMKLDGTDTEGRFAVAQFPHIPPRTLAAPLHRHHKEDEYCCILEGALGLQLGEDVVIAKAGTWVIKPRGQWHTFWNAGDLPCRTIEIVSPGGLENYFREVASVGADLSRLAQLNEKYSIDMDFASVPVLCERFGVSFPQL